MKNPTKMDCLIIINPDKTDWSTLSKKEGQKYNKLNKYNENEEKITQRSRITSALSIIPTIGGWHFFTLTSMP